MGSDGGAHTKEVGAPPPATDPDDPGCFVVIGVPIVVEVATIAFLILVETPFTPTVQRMLKTAPGLVALSASAFFVVCIVMIAVLGFYDRRKARRRARRALGSRSVPPTGETPP